MKNLILILSLALGFAIASPAFARDNHEHAHHGGKHHGGQVQRGPQQRPHHHGGQVHHRPQQRPQQHNYKHHNSGLRFDFYVGPGYRYPQPYPRPYPRPYPAPAPSIRVLVTEYCHGRVLTHYVWARWDRYRGGYWFYDCNGFYRRAR